MVLTQCSDIKVIVGTFLSQAFKFFKIGHEYFINNSMIDDVYEMEIYKRFSTLLHEITHTAELKYT